MINSQDAEQVIAFQDWHPENCSDFLDIFASIRIFRISEDIGNVDRSPVKRRTADSAMSAGTKGILGRKIPERLRSVEGRHHPQQLPIEAPNERPVSSTQSD